jgi:protein O-mannosyl-transferase
MVVLTLAVLVVYGRLAGAEFTSWDDGDTVAHNPLMNPPTLEHLKQAWTHFSQGLYVPVTNSLWMALATIARVDQPDDSGATLNPYVFHCANLLAHLVTVIAAYQLLRRLTGEIHGALFGALFFALHPIQVEAVAWVSGLKDVLAGCFGMIALWRYVIRAQQDRKSPDALGAIALMLALLCKPSATMLPPIALVIDWLILRRSFRRALASSAVWFAIDIPFLLIAKLAQYISPYNIPPFWSRPFLVGDTITFYLRKLLLPYGLTMDYGHTWQRVLQGHGYVVIWLIPVLLAILLLKLRRSHPYLMAGGLIFVVAIAPVSGITAFGYQFVSTTADHYLYIAMLGPALAIACFIASRPAKNVYRIFSAVTVILAALSFHQAGFWRSDFALLTHAIDVNHRSFLAHNNLGLLYGQRGDLAKATNEFRAAVALTDRYPNPYESLAHALADQGDLEGAASVLNASMTIRSRMPGQYPDYIDDHLRVGQLLLQAGKYRQAIPHFQALLDVKPDNIEARKYLALAQEKLATTKPSPPKP